MKSGYKVGDVMKQNPTSISPTTTVKEAACLMRDNAIGSLLVVENNKLLGIVTKTDLVRNAMASGMPVTTPIDQVMTHEHDIASVTAEDDLFEAIEKMNDHKVKHMPVESNGKVLGVITMTDVLKLEPQIFNLMQEKLNMEH